MNDRDARNTSSPPDGGDEVRITKHEGRGRRPRLLYKMLTLAAFAASAGIVILYVRDAIQPASATTAVIDNPRAANGAVAEASNDSVARPSDTIEARPVAVTAAATSPTLSAQDMSRDLSEFYVPGQPVPTMGEVIARLNKAGVRSGIGAFSPPGTSPPLVGLAVPGDFPLPEGYVRHHQATDDGQTIEAILMFSPDFEFFDASGQRIAIPEDRVVPPELAPPGMPIRVIDIPRPR
jgi:hypothetical protein